MKMHSFSVLMVMGFLAVSCAKDRKLEDYRRDKVNEKLTEFQGAVGEYPVELLTKVDGVSLGRAVMQFELTETEIPSEDKLSSERRAGIKAILQVTGSNQTVLETSEPAFYDPPSGDIRATFPIKLSTGESRSIIFKGNVKNGSLTGELYVPGYSSEGVVLRGERADSDSQNLLAPVPSQPVSADSYRFEGTVKYPRGEEWARMGVKESLVSTSIRLYFRLSPVRVVDINYQDSFNSVTYTAEFNSLTGRVSARLNAGFEMNCAAQVDGKVSRIELSSVKGWNCAITTPSGAVLEVKTSKVEVDGGKKKP